MKKKKLLLVLPVVAVVAIAGVFISNKNKAPQGTPVELTTLKTSNVRSTISASGTIQSADSISVYSELTFPIKDVRVKVGDHVNAGDVLATIDSETLQNNIRTSQANIDSAEKTAQQQIKTSQKAYDDAKYVLDKGKNSQINQAQDLVNTSKIALDDAQRKYDNAKANLDKNLNDTLVKSKYALDTADVALSRAQKDLRDRLNELGSGYKDDEKDYNKALKDYEQAVKRNKPQSEIDELKEIVLDWKRTLQEQETEADRLYGTGGTLEQPAAGSPIKELRQAVSDAQREYDNANQAYTLAKKDVDEELKTYASALSNAKITYEGAQTSLKTAQTIVQQDLERNQMSIETSRIAANTQAQRSELKGLQDQLAKCEVVAPVSGTITAVYAKEGAAPAGALFLIENTSALEAVVNIKEYDVNSITPGMRAVVESDAAGNKEFEGYLERVSPTAVKVAADADAQAQAAAKTTAEFEATILITTQDPSLKIGMHTDADIITAEKKDVFAVPFEAVGVDKDGKDVIYVLKPGEKGTFTAEAISVKMGLETDYAVEISGDKLKNGMQIVSEAKGITPGMLLQVNTQSDAASTAKQGAKK